MRNGTAPLIDRPTPRPTWAAGVRGDLLLVLLGGALVALGVIIGDLQPIYVATQ